MSTPHRTYEIQTPMNMEQLSTSNAATRRSSGTGCVRKLTWSLVLIFVLFMVSISIAWHFMGTHEPEIGVMSVSVSNFSVSNTQLRGKFVVEFTIRNPNKRIEVVLDSFNVMVLYGQVVLSVAEVQPVYLEKMVNKTVKVELVVRDPPKLVHKVVPEELVKEWNKGVVNFDVKMVVRARFDAGVLPSREKFLDVYCGDLDVGFFSAKDTGKLLGVGKNCGM